MHGIFVGEVQALEGAGRTCFDFDDTEAPFQLKLDMARQCWDESRHVEISVKLTEHMGTEIGEFAEQTMLYEAACNPDPVLRLTGVNRALEGLAIDVFNTMRDFGQATGDTEQKGEIGVPEAPGGRLRQPAPRDRAEAREGQGPSADRAASERAERATRQQGHGARRHDSDRLPDPR